MPSLSDHPRGVETLALDVILATLRDDPDLASYGVTVWGPEGSRDQLPRFTPNAGDLPLIRLVDGDFPSRWQDNESHQGKLNVELELFSPGLDYAGRFALFRLLVGALFPADPDRRAVVEGRFAAVVGWTQRTLTQGGARKVSIGADDHATKASAMLVLNIDLLT